MAQRITKSVGRSGGVNLAPDVTTVQTLLNNVALGDGGPPVALVVDGKCGPKTIDAIQKFQVRQFGWGGADGRVDPDGRTLARLNELAPSTPVQPPLPSPFPPLTTTSVMLCPHGGPVQSIPTGPPPLGPVPNGIPLKATDPCVVAGCTSPMPCVRVQWVGGPSQALDARSIGLCMTASGIPQGSVLIVKA